MNRNVSGLSRNNALIGLKEHVDYGLVGLGSSHQEEHLCIGTATGSLDLISRTLGVSVSAIAHILLHSHICKPL